MTELRASLTGAVIYPGVKTALPHVEADPQPRFIPVQVWFSQE